jgi:hypothetical protein
MIFFVSLLKSTDSKKFSKKSFYSRKIFLSLQKKYSLYYLIPFYFITFAISRRKKTKSYVMQVILNKMTQKSNDFFFYLSNVLYEYFLFLKLFFFICLKKNYFIILKSKIKNKIKFKIRSSKNNENSR